MTSEELSSIFSLFCHAWKYNSFSAYLRGPGLMFQQDDFNDALKSTNNKRGEYSDYCLRCEMNRIALLKNFMKHNIDFRQLMFVDFVESKISLSDQTTVLVKPALEGYAIFSSGSIQFKLNNLQLFHTSQGLRLNADTCSSSIEII